MIDSILINLVWLTAVPSTHIFERVETLNGDKSQINAELLKQLIDMWSLVSLLRWRFENWTKKKEFLYILSHQSFRFYIKFLQQVSVALVLKQRKRMITQQYNNIHKIKKEKRQIQLQNLAKKIMWRLLKEMTCIYLYHSVTNE